MGSFVPLFGVDMKVLVLLAGFAEEKHPKIY
jgi:hypothetical protein